MSATNVSTIINSLTANSRALGTYISLMTDRRVEIDSLLRFMKLFCHPPVRLVPLSLKLFFCSRGSIWCCYVEAVVFFCY